MKCRCKSALAAVMAFFVFGTIAAYADEPSTGAIKITGNSQLDAQFYAKDPKTKAEEPNEKVLSNGFLYLNLNSGNFNAGIRYENYANKMLGFDNYKDGSGIGFRFFEFKGDMFDATAGNFYEQFGSGMILRAYEDRAIGVDNALDGIRVKLRPCKGLEIKGLFGKQKLNWEDEAPGIIRGFDANASLNDLFEPLAASSFIYSAGLSVVSRYQQGTSDLYNIPDNVLAWSGRFGLNSSSFNLDAEYAEKINDPHSSNNFSYNKGTGLIVNSSVFGEGYGLSLNVHRIDNMEFRSDREATVGKALIGFVPALTRQHGYRFPSMYPYATQLNGEVGLQAQFDYTFSDESIFGHGMSVSFNYSLVKALDTTANKPDSLRTYNSHFFGTGSRTYYQDFNFDISKKWSSKFKTNLTVAAITYDSDLLKHGGAKVDGNIRTFSTVLDGTYKFTSTNSLRVELEHMFCKQDSTVILKPTDDNSNGNWAMLLLEYAIPNWYFTVYDEYNYGNKFSDYKLHYPSASVAYTSGAFRGSFGYGRQRKGLLCVGGVCREVPASSGFTLSLSSSF